MTITMVTCCPAGVVVNVINYTCALPALTSVRREKGISCWPLRNCFSTRVCEDFKGVCLGGGHVQVLVFCIQFCAIFKLPEDNYMYPKGFLPYAPWKQIYSHLILSVSQISSNKRFFVCLSGAQNIRWAIIPDNRFWVFLYLKQRSNSDVWSHGAYSFFSSWSLQGTQKLLCRNSGTNWQCPLLSHYKLSEWRCCWLEKHEPR